MKKIRTNASLAAVAANARAKANKAEKAWRRWKDEKAVRLLTFEEQCRTEAAWNHYSDLAEIASHLERLAEKA